MSDEVKFNKEKLEKTDTLTWIDAAKENGRYDYLFRQPGLSEYPVVLKISQSNGNGGSCGEHPQLVTIQVPKDEAHPTGVDVWSAAWLRKV